MAGNLENSHFIYGTYSGEIQEIRKRCILQRPFHFQVPAPIGYGEILFFFFHDGADCFAFTGIALADSFPGKTRQGEVAPLFAQIGFLREGWRSLGWCDFEKAYPKPEAGQLHYKKLDFYNWQLEMCRIGELRFLLDGLGFHEWEKRRDTKKECGSSNFYYEDSLYLNIRSDKLLLHHQSPRPSLPLVLGKRWSSASKLFETANQQGKSLVLIFGSGVELKFWAIVHEVFIENGATVLRFKKLAKLSDFMRSDLVLKKTMSAMPNTFEGSVGVVKTPDFLFDMRMGGIT